MFSRKYCCDIDFRDKKRMELDAMNFWQRVLTLQNEKGFDFSIMAYYAGLTDEEYIDLQQSNKEPTLSSAVGIAFALDVSVEFLVTGNSSDVYQKRLENVMNELDKLRNYLVNAMSILNKAELDN